MRYERFRPEAFWGEKDLNFYEEKCISAECPAEPGVEDHRTKCLKPGPVVIKGMARSVFTVFYPLIGKVFEAEIKKVYDKLQPYTT